MILFKKASDLTDYLQLQKQDSTSIGFVPTMGALHSGHLSLIEGSKKNNKLTVCSIFVNPTQFNDPKDFQKYPVTLEQDILMLHDIVADILFLPSVEEMYPNGFQQQEQYELGYLETILEGAFRPGHFQGVCQIMQRLIEMVKPDNLYMGQKDYQQCLVVRHLLKIKNLPGVLHICPTSREADGLAMSSRNLRFNAAERSRADAIYTTLQFLKSTIEPGTLTGLKQEAGQLLSAKGFTIDYVEIADAETLELVTSWNGKNRLTGLIAAFNNDIRLIDNMIITGN